MKRNSNWILFSKYFAGECSESEIEKLHKLIDKRASYRKLFDNLNKDNELIEKHKEMKAVDVDSAWNNISQRIQAKGEGIKIPLVPSGRKFGRTKMLWAAVAASVLLIAGLGLGYQYFSNSQNNDNAFITVHASGTGTPVLLPDNSIVYLNRNSKITYPIRFSNSTREISLNGEAYFEVRSAQDNPFIVKAGKARVKVLGTSFTVNNRMGKNLVEVFVETGLVQFYKENMENEGLMIETGYVGQISGNSQGSFPNKNENIIAWKTRKIIFHNTRLTEVIKVLEDVYGEEIKCENKGALNWPLTNTFDNQNLQSVINVLAETFRFEVEKEKSGFVLSGGIY